MKYIELFAGCGGLSLGLNAAGGELVFANEVSPMASETYAYNFFNEDWSKPGECKRGVWLGSQYSRKNFAYRLRENPLEIIYPSQQCEVQQPQDLQGKVVVGSIKHLNRLIEESPSFLKSFIEIYGNGQVDLVSGGPPCQSFSMAGMRQLKNERNTLPWEFAKFVAVVKPKLAMLENVQGILNAFVENGVEFHAWLEVCKAFAKVGYTPICFLVNAKNVGVAQNRPRFIMLALSQQIFNTLGAGTDSKLNQILEPSGRFYANFHRHKSISTYDLPVFDLSSGNNVSQLLGTPFERLFSNQVWTVEQAIGDLVHIDKVSTLEELEKGEYAKHLETYFSSSLKNRSISNLKLRSNSIKIKQRFRVYQLIATLDKSSAKVLRDYLKGNKPELTSEIETQLLKLKFLASDGISFLCFNRISDLSNYLNNLKTKKQTQRALVKDAPAPAALSIPDDACHYSQLRTLSVREMARIQSFPDNFEFRSKVTTGGTNRRFEVPQYTQVGNAVPPMLGLALGEVCKGILKISKNNESSRLITQRA